ncbi:helix-turn-helix domain-containing protein [Saccharopolyspora indica]|uniref:helix-turn-helix domain-containing protein n=1 Tax=Saccharopolyspora indica TaxID=1229659 RepID=UPI0022EAE978|nr:helix-turn-helix transcriptional regulator [Saccharopolyspora indica]MDA3643877.1 helix-turn-helix transcriptional regulator [Saccharopolyspora indica]
MTWKKLDQIRRENPITDREEYDESYAEASLAFSLARLVYGLRTQAGLTQTELARRMGTTQSSVARWESGGSMPTIDLLDRLGQAVDVRLELVASPNDDTEPRDTGSSAVAFGSR